MFEKLITQLSQVLQKIENAIGLKICSAIIGLLFLGLAILYIRPSFIPMFHGTQFSLLSVDPFDFSYNNPLRTRILAPLLGYLTFLRGEYFFILPIVFCFLMISFVYYHYRRKEFSPVESLLLAGLISFSGVVLIPIFAAGYTDIVTYFFIFLAFSNSKKLVRSAILFSLALLNHESALFLLPGLILYANFETPKQNRNIFRIVGLYFIACIPHILYATYIYIYAPSKYTIEFYFSYSNIYHVLKNLFPNLFQTIFFAFKLFWIFPLIFFFLTIKNKQWQKLIIVITIVAGAFAQLIIAYDYTRMVVLAFPAILISAEYVLKVFPKKYAAIGLIILLLNFLIPQYQYNYDGAVKLRRSDYSPPTLHGISILKGEIFRDVRNSITAKALIDIQQTPP